MMLMGRIVNILPQCTLVFSNGSVIKFPFKTKHNLYDIIDENDNLLTHSYAKIDFENKFKYLKNKFALINKARHFFKQNGFEEVLTNKLKKQYLQERHIKKLKTKHGFLVPSFEIEHKKILCLGFEKIFELNFAYRDDFEDFWHSKEFLMLEWYRAFEEPQKIIDDFKHLCIYLNNSNNVLKTRSGNIINFNNVCFHTYRELFLKHLHLDIESNFDKNKIIIKHHLETNLTKLQVLDFLFATYIEKKLGKNCIDIVYDFPHYTFLAKKEDKYFKRFEFYIDGVEIANCYEEENDFSKLNKYFNHYTDKEFIDFMSFGMPPASGIAFGFDRILKLLVKNH